MILILSYENTAFFIFFISIASYSQNKVLVLKKNNSEFTKEITEKKRIKVETIDGLKHVGRFTILDSTSIIVAEKVILLEDIVRMRPKSLFGTIVNPIIIAYGSFMLISGVLVAGTVYGVLLGGSLVAMSIPAILIPAIAKNYSSEEWKYLIKIE